MKRKKIISILVMLCMTMALAIPALAAPATAPQDAMTPGEGEDPAVPTDGRSPGDATIIGEPGNWEVDHDDSNVTGPIPQDTESAGADIAVWARIVDLGDADSIVYCIDIEWGNMKFVFAFNSGAWNPEFRKYDEVDDGEIEGEWWINNAREKGEDSTDEFYIDGLNNQIIVTNRSNADVEAAFSYTFLDSAGAQWGDVGENQFNTENVEDLVVGNFFRSNAGALAAALLLTDEEMTDDDDGIEEIAGYLPYNTPILIETADIETEHGNLDTLPSEEVFFAFSGTPDNDSDLVGAQFTKVGIITVTIIPTVIPDSGGSDGAAHITGVYGMSDAISINFPLPLIDTALSAADFTIGGSDAEDYSIVSFAISGENLNIILDNYITTGADLTIAFSKNLGDPIVMQPATEITFFSAQVVICD